MSAWSFYSPSTGLFTGRIFRGDDSAIGANTPAGTVALAGEHDSMSRRVDLSALPEIKVVDWQPPAPADTAMQTWQWDSDAKRWISTPTLAAVAASARADRDARLTACDWVVAHSAETAQPIPQEWRSYRTALRDMTTQAGFPLEVEWPTPPKR